MLEVCPLVFVKVAVPQVLVNASVVDPLTVPAKVVATLPEVG